ncbi:MAG: hypothetical protein [Caudoviricetes sp.]|nr:MAG: hypothetical protein [Caudoviricetes sp.]
MISIDEIKSKAPSGTTHYMVSTLILMDGDSVTYFKFSGGKYYEYFSHHFARYETGVCHKLIKPL